MALNDTGSAGLGISVKGRCARALSSLATPPTVGEQEKYIDLGIYIKTLMQGGAAQKV